MYPLDNKKEHCPISCIEDDNENASKIYGFSNALDKKWLQFISNYTLRPRGKSYYLTYCTEVYTQKVDLKYKK